MSEETNITTKVPWHEHPILKKLTLILFVIVVLQGFYSARENTFILENQARIDHQNDINRAYFIKLRSFKTRNNRRN